MSILLTHNMMNPFNTKHTYVFDLDATLLINRKNIVNVIIKKNEFKVPKRLKDDSIPYVEMDDKKIYHLTDKSVPQTIGILYDLGHKIYVCTNRKEEKKSYIAKMLSGVKIKYHKIVCIGRKISKGTAMSKVCTEKRKMVVVDDVKSNLDTFDESTIKIHYFPYRLE